MVSVWSFFSLYAWLLVSVSLLRLFTCRTCCRWQVAKARNHNSTPLPARRGLFVLLKPLNTGCIWWLLSVFFVYFPFNATVGSKVCVSPIRPPSAEQVPSLWAVVLPCFPLSFAYRLTKEILTWKHQYQDYLWVSCFSGVMWLHNVIFFFIVQVMFLRLFFIGTPKQQTLHFLEPIQHFAETAKLEKKYDQNVRDCLIFKIHIGSLSNSWTVKL